MLNLVLLLSALTPCVCVLVAMETVAPEQTEEQYNVIK